MQVHRGPQPDSRRAAFLRWAERLLVLGGAGLLVWCALVVADAVVAQHAARRSLETAPAGAATSPFPPVPAVAADHTVDVGALPRSARRGDAVGDLSIPRLGLSAIVLHGSDARTLRRGPGHLENTALPGQSGNTVIAGHRDSFFRLLRDIRVGDDIFIDTPRGRFHYRVASLRVVPPFDLSVLEPTEAPMLTLITCYPFWALGSAPDRFIVRAADVTTRAAPHSVHYAQSAAAPPVRDAASGRRHDVAADDRTLVRLAIERFRVAHNARLAGTSPPLQFESCDVAVADDEAQATCASPPAVDGAAAPLRIFTLERAGGHWAIRSIVLN
jgi:sortase A